MNKAAATMKLPGPDHPITISQHGARVRVTFAGRVIADTTQALRLAEASYKPVLYIPRSDADMSALPGTLCGVTSNPFPRWRGSRIISRSIQTVWTRSRRFDAA